ncbi:MAG TPA: phospholipid carrier-dependent glycosyltransferase, partial [Thermoanaerobaculia bacterium]|nr:phospholipid carrier-dependent glycosyltransferase [Thermoanaerobaculia bacterium]
MTSSRLAYLVAFLALAAFVALTLGDVLTTSPTSDETVHLSAGWSYLATHDFRLNPEHPPLLKVLAAAPLMSMRISRDALQTEGWRDSIAHLRGEWSFPHQFLYEQKDGVFVNDSATMFRRARIVLLLFCGVGTALIIFLWALELWGPWGAALSMALYCFDPNFIAHSGLVTTDVGVCFLMTAAVYLFWRWCRKPSILNASLFALAFAVAQIVKFSALFLFLLIPILALFAFRKRGLRGFALYAIGLAAAWVVIWAAYGFRFAASESPLPMKQAVDEWYAKLHFIGSGEPLTDESLRKAAETTPTGWFGRVLELEYDHHLLPEAYVYGIAQMQSFGALRTSYLRGEQSLTGFRSYFLQAFLYKTPIATIAAILCALFIAFRSRRREPFLLVPAALYLGFALSSHLDIGVRHLLPMYPFLYVLCGILAGRFFIAAAAAALSCLVVFAPFDPMWG